jgi:uncharacterized protein (TIGR02118 family)
MVTLLALYKVPDDKEAFDLHYRETHTPLTSQMPGLRKFQVMRVKKMLTPPTSTLSEQPYLLVTLYFDDKAALDAAMKSDAGMKAAQDLMGFAGKLVSLVIGEVEEIPV